MPKRTKAKASRPPAAKRTRTSPRRVKQTSARQDAPSRREGPRRGRSARQPSSEAYSTESPTMPTDVPQPSRGYASQQTVTTIPQEVLRQLSTVLQQLTTSIQPSQVTNPPQRREAETLSEASDHQQPTIRDAFMHRSETDGTGEYPTETTPGVSLPPVPPRIKERITAGEFIEFSTLLPKAMFSGSSDPEVPKSLTVQFTPTGNDLSLRPSQTTRKILSFASWMEAWNIYLAILIDHSPARAPQLVAYQRIITSASINYPLATWLNYDVQFRTLAASDPSLRWDIRHTDLWLQCVTSTSSPMSRWPCPYCGATTHYPSNCPFCYHTAPISASGQQPSTSTPTSGQQPPTALFSSGQQPSTSTSTTGQPPTIRESKYVSPTCHAFNRSFCRRRNCAYTHCCERCGANHSAKHCPIWGGFTQ